MRSYFKKENSILENDSKMDNKLMERTRRSSTRYAFGEAL